MAEKILQKNTKKYVLFPIEYPLVWEYCKKQLQAFWTANEIDFCADINDWNSLNENEKNFLENILAFFAGSDGIIYENINCNFSQEIEIPEIRYFYSNQGFMENIHSECYSLMIETYIKDEKRKIELFNAIEKLPAVQKKARWAEKWLNNKLPFKKRIIAFAIVEGIFFAGSFCAIFWLKNIQGKMTKALAKSNELIARDESLHAEFAVHLYSYLENKLTQNEINEIFIEAVNIEIEFITESLKCNLLGMNSEKMILYIKFVADRLIQQLGYNKIFNISECPFKFMDTISLDGKSNFFEQRVTDYNRSEELNGKGLDNADILDDF